MNIRRRIVKEYGYTIEDQHGTLSGCGLIIATDSEGKEYFNYCADHETGVIEGHKYSIDNLKNNTYISELNTEHVRSILQNSYPFISEEEIETRSGISVEGYRELVTATQMAVWYYTNGSITICDAGSDEIEKRVENLRDWYINLPPSKAISRITEIDTYHEFVGDTLHIYYKATEENKNTSEIVPNIKIVPNLSYKELPKDGDYHHISIDNVSDKMIKIEFDATQSMINDAFLLSPDGGRKAAQTLGTIMNDDVRVKLEKSYENLMPNGSLRLNSMQKNAMFRFVDENNNVFERMTDENGQIDLSQIRYGKYRIQQIAPPKDAPEGYRFNTEIVDVTIASQIQVVVNWEEVSENEELQLDVPETGSEDNLLLLSILAMLSMVSVVGVVRFAKR